MNQYSKDQNPGIPKPVSQCARMDYLDNLKFFLAVLVVMHHAGQPYGPTGGSWPISHVEKFDWLGPFFHINASFFMGLFFLISGYFVQSGYESKGWKAFLVERFTRFGIPVLLFGLICMPLIRHFTMGLPWSEGIFPFEWAHLWFLGHLLIYALGYTLFRAVAGGHGHVGDKQRAFPANVSLLGYAAVLAFISMLVRSRFPIDLWVRFGVPAEVAHLPQYASLFVIGVIAGGFRWFERIPERQGNFWLLLAIAAVMFRCAEHIYGFSFMDGTGIRVGLAWNFWEALLCVSMCVGLIHGFRRYMNRAGVVARFLGRQAFGIYVLHLPILVFIQAAFEHTSLGPLALTVVTGGIAVGCCLFICSVYDLIVRRMPSFQSRRKFTSRIYLE